MRAPRAGAARGPQGHPLLRRLRPDPEVAGGRDGHPSGTLPLTAAPAGSLQVHCRICDSAELELAIDLGQQPWCNRFLRKDEVGTEPYYPLRVVYCHGCRAAQLDYTVPKEAMFRDHTYLSGTTQSLAAHFRAVALDVDARLADRPRKSILDIGSNDGTQLKQYLDLGYSVLGVDPSATAARIANASGIETVEEFFDLELAKSLDRQFDVINASGVFFHLEELHSAAEGIRHLLDREGVFVVQFLYMKRIIENCAFDQIYHEHLLYYNLSTIDTLLRRHGLEMFDAHLASIHGGSIVGFVTHEGSRDPTERLLAMRAREAAGDCNQFSTYSLFERRIQRKKEENLELLERARKAGKSIFGLGAPAKGNTLLNFFGIGTQYLDCLVEINELRRGLYSPGMHVPVVIEREIEAPPDLYYVLAWNFKGEILGKNRTLLERGVEFFFPIDPDGSRQL